MKLFNLYGSHMIYVELTCIRQLHVHLCVLNICVYSFFRNQIHRDKKPGTKHLSSDFHSIFFKFLQFRRSQKINIPIMDFLLSPVWFIRSFECSLMGIFRVTLIFSQIVFFFKFIFSLYFGNQDPLMWCRMEPITHPFDDPNRSFCKSRCI